MRFKQMAAVTAACAVVFSAGVLPGYANPKPGELPGDSGRRPVYVNPTAGEFPIVGWYSMPDSALTPERYKEMREAGFNVSFSHLKNNDQVERSLKAAEGSGVSLIIMTDDLYTDTRVTVERFRNHPNVAGWYLRDEPTTHSFAELSALRDQVVEADSVHFPYVNLLPDFVAAGVLGAESYDDYVQRSVDELRLPFLSYDMYPIINTPETGIIVRENLYSNLESVSRIARANGMPFWAFCLSGAHAVYPVPRSTHLRLEAFAALAYGAQGLQYFTYWDPVTEDNYHNSPVDASGRKTDVYYLVSDLNREIQALRDIFLGSEVVNVWHTGSKLPEGTQPLGSLPSPFTGTIESDGDGLVVSHFKGGDGHEYLILVNRDIVHTQRVKMPFKGELTLVNGDGSTRRASAAEDVRPGDYLLYRL